MKLKFFEWIEDNGDMLAFLAFAVIGIAFAVTVIAGMWVMILS